MIDPRRLVPLAGMLILGLVVAGCAPANDEMADGDAAASTSLQTASASPAPRSMAAVITSKPATYEDLALLTQELMAAVERDCMEAVTVDQAEGLRTAFELDLAVLEANSGPIRPNTYFGLSFEPMVITLCLNGQSPHDPNLTQ